jgi:NAD(P)-dependent dehydrogenase (short-subunit alcohol dehydrogenase family)
MSVLGWVMGRGASGFGYGSTAEQVTEGRDLTGRTYLVTGCNSGLGLETLRVLALRGARVLGAARTEAKAREACDSVAPMGVPIACELSEPSSVRAAVAAVRSLGHPIDGVIANAGIMALPTREVRYGVELQLLTNHVGHFLLVTGLLDRLTATGRVVMVSSAAHHRTYPDGIRLDDPGAERGYSEWEAYGQSKLANLLFAKHLATRLPSGQTANSLHPGVIRTNLGRHMNPALRLALRVATPLVMKSIEEGSATQCYVATHPDVANVSGEYFADSNVARPSAWGRDAALAAALWDRTEALVAGL